MAKTKFRPLHDRVVVKRIDAEEKSRGGIIIPDTAQEKPSQGEVIAVGPGGRDEAGKIIKPDVKAGDRVLFGKWSGTEVKLDGEDLRHHGRDRLTSGLVPRTGRSPRLQGTKARDTSSFATRRCGAPQDEDHRKITSDTNGVT